MLGIETMDRGRRRRGVQRATVEAANPTPVTELPLRSKLDFSCTMAYQPIVDLIEQRTVAYEALVRGLHNEPAATVLRDGVDDDVDGAVEQRCGTLAVEIAALLGIHESGADLYVNFSPEGGTLGTMALCSSIEAAERAGLPLDRLILEITEREPFRNAAELKRTLAPYRARGLRTALDDFGAGFAGLTTLAAFQPNIVKIDMGLTWGIEADRAKRVIVQAVLRMCCALGVEVIAEGVEGPVQRDALLDLGVRLMQGNFFSEPGFERLPVWPREAGAA